MTAFYDQTGRTWKWKKNLAQRQVDERERRQSLMDGYDNSIKAVNWVEVQNCVERNIKPCIAIKRTGVSRTQYWKMRKEHEQEQRKIEK
ncbi:hypothetical protein AL190_002198 [Vibrio parahaemolyticus]|uniref:hypothetical protein n=1 Tax=Vibrio parahaemolyticus TaxID=670 RepID=UPI00084B485A|nr:hypothetical protein [Vibrio parahaemolyticus]EHH1183077.1 hypothetical protein [Vibrio vulnificus]EIV8647406.1 hypothetical protein [Vibrio parahaemolyticus]EJE4733599.1 hypothetical protein [Vibrio parahaemolyticus]ODZ36582.1 hypothetical protein BBN02_12770 [Vibrio parahaemolyticus]